MAIDLVALAKAKADEVAADVEPATAAATAMADKLRDATSGYLGGNLSFSGGAGSVTITPVSESGRAVVTTNGTYALANTGRHQAPGARGGSWGGFGITASHSAEAFAAGRDAFLANADWGR